RIDGGRSLFLHRTFPCPGSIAEPHPRRYSYGQSRHAERAPQPDPVRRSGARRVQVGHKQSPRYSMSNKMWGGRFATGPDAIMEEINASIGFDQRLYPQDIAGSIAHATMLAETGILT